MALNVGDTAPEFKAHSTNGEYLDLSQIKEPLILFFYPKDFTPGCTKEACSFRDNFDFFKDLDIQVYGISTDPITKHQEFKKKYNLQFDLLSDVSGKICKAYKSYVPILGIAKRTTYLIDSEKKIAAVYSDLLGAEKHIKEMIKKVNGAKVKADHLP